MPSPDMPDNSADRRRRSVMIPVSSQVTNLLRRNSLAGQPPGFIYPDANNRRLSISSGLGLSGTSGLFDLRRSGSLSADSDNAVEDPDEDSPTSTTSPSGAAANFPPSFGARRMSLGAQAALRGVHGTSATSDQGSFDWSNQLRERAQSSFTGKRFSFGGGGSPPTDHALPIQMPQAQPQPIETRLPVEMPAPPTQPVPPARPQRQKPDAFQERILKGDFYMD